MDVVDAHELDTAAAFLRRTLAQHGVDENVPIFRLSARAALRARIAGNATAFEASVFGRWKAFANFVAYDKRRTLVAAIAKQAGEGRRALINNGSRNSATGLSVAN